MRVLSFLFLFGSGLYVNSETCPPKEALEATPCRCEEGSDGDIIVKCTGMKLENLREPFKVLSGKKQVEMELISVDLGHVPANFFQGIGITKLKINSCALDSLAPKDQPALLGLEESLERLDISSSFKDDDDLTKPNFGHLRSLRHYDLSLNVIKEMGNDWLDNVPTSLIRIFMYENRIGKIGNKVFANLSNLEMIVFGRQQVRAINRSMFPTSASRLYYLDLMNNDLTDLPEDMFKDMPALKYLYLGNNKLTTLDQDTWEPVWENLSTVNLYGNPLQCDADMHWLFDLSIPVDLAGTCIYPRKEKGSLYDFIKNKGM